jgi:hypothetical protein
MMDIFETTLQQCPHEMRMALIDVCDTADMCRRWFEVNKVSYTAADLITMARMVLEREIIRRNQDEEVPI